MTSTTLRRGGSRQAKVAEVPLVLAKCYNPGKRDRRDDDQIGNGSSS